jgi:hypothetical protein
MKGSYSHSIEGEQPILNFSFANVVEVSKPCEKR